MSQLVEARIEELHAVRKNLSQMELKIALCYPNVYRVGMASLAIQLIYRLWNSYETIACERSFLPLKKIVEPYTLESDRPLREMDIIAFTMQYETDFTNILDIIARSHIPLESKDRDDNHPLILAGGPCAQANPVPMAPYIDAFMLGDLESVNNQLIEEALLPHKTRSAQLAALDSFPWIWVPNLNNDKPVHLAPRGNLDDYFYPIEQIIQQVEFDEPFHGVFGKSFLLEVVRGCNRGCAFCLTGKLNRPRRNRSLSKLQEISQEGVQTCEVEKITTIGAGISDYPYLEELCQNFVSNNLTFSLPSLRADTLTDDLVQSLVQANQRTITTAPEAGTERLRQEICKGVTDAEIIHFVQTAAAGGLSKIKAYFILGLPGEEQEDIEGIVRLAEKMVRAGKTIRDINFSAGFFVPKPRTLLQDASLFSLKDLRGKQKFLQKSLAKISRVTSEFFDPRWARIQAILSTGGEEISFPLKLAAKFGGGLGDWRRALNECDLAIDKVVEEREYQKEHPWDFIEL
ncbi:MAG: radical SAM protein [Candidatus Heimdallarchaeota archaeon]|nr:radical SAM protein [Candidatus Heimdallarchaeota archaeon]